MKEGMNQIVSFNSIIPAAVLKEVADKQADIISGKFKVFSGPIKAQDGTVKVAAGSALGDPEIDSIKFYTEGVIGDLPK
jgi:simple sugar transport system substrate-binding protein